MDRPGLEIEVGGGGGGRGGAETPIIHEPQ